MNVYDFDNTIYNGDSTADFYLFCLKRHPKIISLLPSLIFSFCRFYIFKIGTKTEFKEKMYRFLTLIDLERDLLDFWHENEKNIKSWYYEKAATSDVIISASPEFLLTPICKKLNINYLLASKVDSHTGEYFGINCHGEEKVVRFNKAFSNTKIHEFYSDSYSDEPLAKIAESAFIVKGNKIEPWNFKN